MSVKKESVSTKCFKKKWNSNPTMELKPVISSRARTSRSIQVDEEVHLILDDSDESISSSVVTPSRKSIQLPRKTYSKRNPIIYQPIIGHEDTNRLKVDTFVNHGASSSILKNSALSSSNKNYLRKRKRDTESIFSKSPVPKKLVKKSTSYKSRNMLQSSTSKDLKPSTSKSFEPVPVKYEGSSDSEIEILSVKLTTTTTMSTNGNMRKFSNSNNEFSSKKSSKCFESMAKKELLMNEAEIAPFMPTNPSIFPDPSNRANSMRWLSSNGTIAVPGYSQGFSPSTLKPPTKSENGGMPAEKNSPVLSEDMKSSNEKRPKGKRELKCLYENLNEISWAQETSFKNLLRSPDYIRHSERSTGRIAGTGKNLRKLKPQTKPQPERKRRETAANLLARKKSKMARLNHTQKGKKAVREKLLSRSQNKEGKHAQILNKKKVLPKLKPSLKCDSIDDDDDTIRYKLAFHPPKPKQNAVVKSKTVTTKTKLSNGLKLKSDPSQINSNAQKVKSNIFKLKPDKPKAKIDVAKVKNYVPIIKYDHSPPSTSGLQSGASCSKFMSHSTNIRNSIKKTGKFKNFPSEMDFFQSMMGADTTSYSAAGKKNDVWVMLQPLENTKLWSPDFYEEFRRYILEQAVNKVIETRDLESVRTMYENLQESLINGPINNSNLRVSKKKKPEEESLRISVRQSEGAFRYKEIVVKKHKFYYQVILMSNGVRQNSLTLEAMKELKDAFILAKKDPNCHAVFLHSLGSHFCTGVDLAPLVGANKKQAAEDMAYTIRELVMTLAFFTKPVIAAVNGTTVGFGVSLLTYCDVILASDKATFCLPSTRLGYLPEGGVTLTLPQVIGTSAASEMFLQGRRLTACEAKNCGLVAEVIFPSCLMKDVLPRLERIAQQPLAAMEATKAMVRCHLWSKLKAHMDHERRLLVEHWLTPQCQENIKNVLRNGWFDE